MKTRKGLYSSWEYKGKRGEHIQSTLKFGVIHLVRTQAGGRGVSQNEYVVKAIL